MEIRESAHRHGVDDADIRNAWATAIRFAEYEYEYASDVRFLVIGAVRHGRLLELVAIPAQTPTRIIHADVLRPKCYEFLR